MGATLQRAVVEVIQRQPGKLSGRPCFPGTRVPVRTLFDCLMAGQNLEEFLEGFPGVTRQQAVNVLLYACGELGLTPTDSEDPTGGRRIPRTSIHPSDEAAP